MYSTLGYGGSSAGGEKGLEAQQRSLCPESLGLF